MIKIAGLFNSGNKALKILFVAAEAYPFAKAGGLGTVMYSLPRAIRKLGHDARVMIPRYAGVNHSQFKITMEHEGLSIPTGAKLGEGERYLICNVKKFDPDPGENGAAVITYFLENQEYFEKRTNIYGYADDAVRWALFGKGVLEFLNDCRKWKPDVIVAADWQAAFLINYLKTVYKENAYLNSIATVFSVHNLYFQGMFDHKFVAEMDTDAGQADLPHFFHPRLLKLNMMRRGIMYADAINTVSPNYAREILTSEYGELLDGLLRERKAVLYGILNGLDYDIVNSRGDPHIAIKYDSGSLEKRRENKTQLQDRFSIKKTKHSFLLGIVSRLDDQKGFSLLFEILETMLYELNIQMVVVGSGEARYMGFFNEISKKFPDRVGVHLKFDTVLPHFVFGGADAILIPSKFEPSGLTQMEAMRYGAVPIVRSTGGLADTVEDYDPVKNTGTGFVFENFHPLSLALAVSRAYENYKHADIWRGIQKRAMEKDFSWEHSAREYLSLFEKAIEVKKYHVLG